MKVTRMSGIVVLALCLAAQAEQTSRCLFEFGNQFNRETVVLANAKVKDGAHGGLLIAAGHQAQWPGITLKAPSGSWDLSTCRKLEFTVWNPQPRPITVHCRVDNPGADGKKNCVTGQATVPAQSNGRLEVPLNATPWRLSEKRELIGMRGWPGQPLELDAGKISQLVVFLNQPAQDTEFEIGPITASGNVTVLDVQTFFPFVDDFGQFIHAEWPGKIHGANDFPRRIADEKTDLQNHPAPAGWNRFGGWDRGPRLGASGFFRVAKHENKWWLVDPEGNLFWSHGIDCVGSPDATPITSREHYFKRLPGVGDPFSRFFGAGNWAPHGYYRDHLPYRTYDFSQANLLLKYGSEWSRINAQITHERLRSWGMNTIANWSSQQVYRQRKTPYTVCLGASGKLLEGSEGYWGKFYDVFDPSFRSGIQRRMAAEKNESAGDPWCLGYFVDNELAWGDEYSLAEATLASPAEQMAKQAFCADLKTKYQSIEKLNAQWATSYASWPAFLAAHIKPDRTKAGPDLKAFYTRTAEHYFQVIREELKAVAPNQLYLGCRFAWVNDLAVCAAAKSCDVISFNRYEFSVEKLSLPAGIDLPVIIGEFHFGALDRGLFHTGLRATASQEDRASKYTSYVQGALKNPRIVGTHWFQYQDQALTGRGDGENYQIGFLDICDNPYPETIQASRAIGAQLYPLRIDY